MKSSLTLRCAISPLLALVSGTLSLSCGLLDDGDVDDGTSGWSGADPFAYAQPPSAARTNAPQASGACAKTLPPQDGEGGAVVVWSASTEVEVDVSVRLAVDACQNAFLTSAAVTASAELTKFFPDGERAWTLEIPERSAAISLAVSAEGTVVVGGERRLFFAASDANAMVLGPELALRWIEPWGDAWVGAGASGYGIGKFLLPNGAMLGGGPFQNPTLGPSFLDAFRTGDNVHTLIVWNGRDLGESGYILEMTRQQLPNYGTEATPPDSLYREEFKNAALLGVVLAEKNATWIAAAFSSGYQLSTGLYEDCSSFIARVPSKETAAGECFLPALLRSDAAGVTAIGLTPAGAGYVLTRLTIGADGLSKADVWDDSDGVPLFKGQKLAAEFLPDGSLLVAGSRSQDSGWWLGRVRL